MTTKPPPSLSILLLFAACCCCTAGADPAAVYVPAGGPVYVNPNHVIAAAAPAVVVQPTVVVAAAAAEPINWLTQTVYGFLDFTTTIGNTVMVFSPQSAPPPAANVVAATAAAVAAPATEAPKPAVNTVIDSQPPTTVARPADIKPSKAVKPSTKPASPAMSSVVHVVASKPDDQPAPKKVHIVSSQVQVVVSADDVPKPTTPADSKKAPVVILSSHVEMRTTEAATQSPAVVVMPAVQPAAAVSSVVEVLSSSSNENDNDDFEPVLQVENNIGEPEYDFLSRQPSEFAEETYRIHNIKPSQSAKPKTRGAAATNRPAAAPAAKHDSLHPTGLVTKLGGTVVKDGATTVHETSVIGTYISGKYAQVLQSTSHIIHQPAAAAPAAGKPKITPTASLRILKTAAPHIPKHHHKHSAERSTAAPTLATDSLPIDEVYGNSPSTNLVRASRRPATASGSFKNRFRQRAGGKDEAAADYADAAPVHSAQAVEIQATPAYQAGGKKSRINKNQKNRFANSNNSNRPESPATVSVYSESATPAANRRSANVANAAKTSPRQGFKPTNTAPSTTPAPAADPNARRFKPAKVQTGNVEDQSSSLYKFRLNRAPGRWQYKTSPKPRITIRKQAGDDAPAAANAVPTPSYDQQQQHDQNDIPSARSDDTDLDSSPSINGDVLNDAETLENAIEHKKQMPVETLKVEISTPANFKDTYYEIATIKSPYTFQVGSVRNTRYITVTSTFEKTLDPEPTSTSILTEPLTENILATTAHLDKEHNLLDSSIATLPPILLPSDQETPPLETLTETFSTTTAMLKTHILPVIREGGGNATSYTLIQTYHVTRLVTATKTLPPMEAYHFNPSKALKEFNSKLDEAGSELNLELDFGDDESDDDDIRKELPADLDLSVVGSDFDLSQVDKSNIPEAHLRPKKKPTAPLNQDALQLQIPTNLTPEQLQQLALLGLYNPGAQLPAHLLIQSSAPVLTYETVYESHVIPIFNGVSTSFSTISRPVATVTKTEYPMQATATLPQLPTPPPLLPQHLLLQQQQQQLQQQHQQLQQQQQQQFQITTAPIITQTMVTEVQSKVLKLTFGAKTAYTTLFSTAVVPTILTTYITQSVPVQQTAAYPGYFPAPFAPFPYVG